MAPPSLQAPSQGHISEYELIRLRNIEESKKRLRELGLLNEDKPVADNGTIRKRRRKQSHKSEDVGLPTRRSSRLSGLKIDFTGAEIDDLDEDGIGPSIKKPKIDEPKIREKRPNSYGPIEGVEIGTSWLTRLDCNADGVHRPTVAGIHPGPEGAYSVVLSGGYDEDYDEGISFTYTGSGGRDLKGTKANPKNLRTAPQSKDQTLNPGNAGLVKSYETKMPIRVVRGHKLKSIYSPEEGYRYDGLYFVEKWWLSTGRSGFKTYKFLFKRCDDQDPPPWEH